MSGLPHFLDSLLTDGGEVVSLTCQPLLPLLSGTKKKCKVQIHIKDLKLKNKSGYLHLSVIEGYSELHQKKCRIWFQSPILK
jgi:hypothetical protein